MHSKSVKLSLAVLSLAAVAVTFNACKKDDKDSTNTPVTKAAVVNNYADIVYAGYSDAVTKAIDLKAKLSAFVASPSAATLQAAKDAYIVARTPYGQTDAFRFYGGPIDDDNGKEGEMNGWPLDENFIDYTVDLPNAGIINDSANYPVISKALIASLNGEGSETNISTGYHAIEFLLWGQDLSDSGPGQRPYTDYVAGTGKNAVRRGQYLLAAADLLIDDLQYTADAWAPGKENYRKTFTSWAPDKSLELIFTGIGKFAKGELYGERMETAYETQLQEDEHSCFSDQTHVDFQLGQLGINNVFYGNYKKLDGTEIKGASIDDLIKAADATLAAQTETALANCKNAVNNIHPPFDQEIKSADGRPRVFAAITAGNVEADKFVAVAKALGITITL